ncbi:hypothetical protein IVB08_34435 [Bradyrhizobium sp. 173]|uniref:hypothetical protein n=1 Tax=Bradyrhizobium sp. 173 TaxID=2782644 RepID=UPI001FF9814D|nr:hypothetical protein [Bradyrhizobium sp. 173]MCK1568958.1 hypothetical protein [Bradyrhizobium sp. 173]
MTYHLFSKSWRAARQSHRCIWCDEQIALTEVYLREKSVYDGHHQNHAWHWDCWFDAQVNHFASGEEDFISGMPRPAMMPFRSMEAS